MCTANRCRSPMAEYLARQSLARRPSRGVCRPGASAAAFGASPGAVAAMARRKLDLRGHASAPPDPRGAG
ncbi:MAG: hypothetical protein IPH81_06375 [Candidatus Microthrix sp.]|nr:hypothetical protein [Candidatus Microthrix sp.]